MPAQPLVLAQPADTNGLQPATVVLAPKHVPRKSTTYVYTFVHHAILKYVYAYVTMCTQARGQVDSPPKQTPKTNC